MGKKYLPWGTPTDSQERFYFPWGTPTDSQERCYFPWGTPTDSQERFYFPCYKSQNYTKITERISKHFVFVSENFSDIGQEITSV